MATLRDLITDALTDLGELAAGEVPPAEDADLCLRALNRRIDLWKAERLNIYTITERTWAIVSGTQTYTVGTGGTINFARPVYIDAVGFRDTSISPAQDALIESFDDDAWQAVPIKTITSDLPTNYYYNPTYPLGTLMLWPVPTSTTLTGVLHAPAAVDEFTSINQAISLPPGYRQFITKSIAIDVAPSFQRQVSAEIREAASEARMIVKRMNARPMEMGFDPAMSLGGCSSYNILTGR